MLNLLCQKNVAVLIFVGALLIKKIPNTLYSSKYTYCFLSSREILAFRDISLLKYWKDSMQSLRFLAGSCLPLGSEEEYKL